MEKRKENYDGANFEWIDRHIHSSNATFGQVSYNPGGYCGPRIQRDFQLVLIRAGGCRVIVDDREYPLQIDRVYLFVPGHREHFVFSATQKTHHFWCSVSPLLLPAEMKRSLLAVARNGFTPSECFSRLISTAFLMNRVASREVQQVIDHLSITLFSEFLHLSMNTTRSLPDVMIPKVLSTIEDHLAEERCLEEAKRISGYSESAFMYKFKAATGHTPSRYLWQLRTEKGIQLLSETGLSISEIAYRCGFKTPFHFSRSVRQLQGLSPRALRQSAWQGQR